MERVEYFKSHQSAALDLIKNLVELESPTSNKEAVDKLADFVSARLRDRDTKTEIIIQANQGNHVRALASAGGLGKALLLCHLDTVWSLGEVNRRPLRIEDGKAYGPGVLDMKASIALVLLIVEAIREKIVKPNKEVIVLFTSDEEDGSHSSRELIEKEAATSDYVLVLEPPLPGNRVKTARKGVGRFDVAVTGRAAHAGVDPERGVNAIEELAHHILALQRMSDHKKGTSVNVGVVSGGTVSNVVPAEARAAVDVRVSTLEEGRQITEKILALKPVNPNAQIYVTGGVNRPPLVRTPAVVQLYEKARDLAAELGFELGEGATGGGSDGCFTAAMGVPTLDGLGVNGAGPHAVDEHIVIADIPYKAALVSRLLETL